MIPRWAVAAVLSALVLSLQGGGQEKEDTAARKRSVVNLKQIALALHNYNDAYKRLPASAHLDWSLRGKFGNFTLTSEELAKAKGPLEKKLKTLPLLSWRVAILPFVEQKKLYEQFRLDEPWDSEHNKKLLGKMPELYAPVTGKAKAGLTYYQVFVGKDTAFDGTLNPRIPASFPDGTTRTFLVVEGGEAVPWTKPQDIPYDGKAVPKLGGLFADGFHAAMADGTIRFVPRGADAKAVRAAITARGGEEIDPPGKEIK
jgi:hypothetical protein